MAQENQCPQCGAEMPPDAPEGLCPKCLMKAVKRDNTEVTLDGSSIIEGPGTKIGRYELLSLIGEGGMGLVYLAEQKEPVKRRVALKIIKPGMDSAQVIARFEAERQALALLDHPNIAHVFDAGTTETGRPYFVMEYVKGMSITRYCDERKLDVEQRLRLFREVCEGVHHAHQKGIIHRDIKPSNILVSMHGDRAVPKIIDFGIAKAAASSLTEKTMFTFQGQLLGTPEYMSPEQVDLATQDIDIRSDIYSLGVVLYELLAGVLPFERESLEKIGFSELQRTLRELEPASPSVRLSNLGEKAKAIADSRMTQVVPLARRLHRELEWIPLKAMRKDRCRRYKSASDMADDIQNYLNGNPLLAGPETAMYRMQKFVHKHAGSVATAALVSVAVILGLVISVIFGCRAEQARQQEEAARIQVEQALARAEKAEKATKEKAEELRHALYVNRINLADKYYEENNIGRVHELLRLCPSELRGWEWDYLWGSSNQAQMTLRGHQDWIRSAAFSQDGKRIVSGSEDSTIKVWDAESGAELMTLPGYNGGVFSVAFSPDDRRIVASGNTIKIWDAESGAELMTLPEHNGYAFSVAFSPDGKWIASGNGNNTLNVWDLENNAKHRILSGHTSIVWSVSFSPDSKRIVSGSNDTTLKVWDVNSGKLLLNKRGDGLCVRSVAFSPDGKRIVSGGYDKMLRMWDAESGKELLTIRGHETGALSVAFSRDGKRIASGGRDQVVKIWDANDGKELMALKGHNSQVASVAFSPDCRRIVSSSDTIKVWDANGGAETMMTMRGHRLPVYLVSFSPDGRRIFSDSRDGMIRIWDVERGVEGPPLRLSTSVTSVAFSPDGRRIVTSGRDQVLNVWDANSGSVLRTLRGHETQVFSVAFSPDGKKIVSGSENGTLKVWDAEGHAVIYTLEGHKSSINSVAFSQDGKRILSGSRDGMIRIWDVERGVEGPPLRLSTSVTSVAFSPDGRQIALSTSGFEGTLKVYDANSGSELMNLRGHSDRVNSVIFSPDGKRIVSGSSDETLKVWDVTSGTELVTLRGHEDDVLSVAYSLDGRMIVSGSNDGAIKVWDTPDPEEITTEILAE